VVEPLRLIREEAAGLLKELKKLCGAGGTLRSTQTRDGRPAFALEIQGDRTEPIIAELERRGYDAHRAGG